VHQRSFHYYESPLLTGSEYTYRQTMGHRRGGMLISTGLGWVSSHVSTYESIWGGPKTAAELAWTLPIQLIRLRISIHKPLFAVIFNRKECNVLVISTSQVGNRKFLIAREDCIEALSTVECIILLTLWFIILSRLGSTAPSKYIALQIYHFCRSKMLQSAEFSSNPNQTHLKQLIKVLLCVLQTSRQVCWGKLELNSAGHRPSRIKFDDPWLSASTPLLSCLTLYLPAPSVVPLHTLLC